MSSTAAFRIASGAIGLGLLGTIAQSSIFTVDGGQRALVFDRFRGVLHEVKGEGMHFLVPLLQYPEIFDIRIAPYLISANTGSKDLQRVSVTLRVLYRPEEESLRNIFLQMGRKYAKQIFANIGNEVLKSVVAQFDAGELITQRELVSLRIREDLVKRAKEFGVMLDDVSITHLEFSKDFMSAIEHKQVAQQNAMRQKFLVEKAKQEKQAEVIIAEGETEAGRMIAEAYMEGNEFLELRRIEAAREIARHLARSRNVVYLPSNGNVLMSLPSTGSS